MCGKEQELIREMRKYDLGVMGVSETKWKGCGARDIEDHYAIFSGVSEGRARPGVAVILSEEMRRCVKSWKCVSERIVVVKLKVAKECYTLVQVYAPTDDSRDEAKDRFYAEMQKVVSSVGTRETLIVMGDLNARVGKSTEGWSDVLGCYGEDTRNESGVRLLSFCSVNELVVTNTWYPHKDIHKYTWVCPGRQLKSLFDYFLVRRETKARVHDVKVVRGAEIGSDHHMVLMKLSKKSKCKGEGRDRVNSRARVRTERLKHRHEQLKYQCRLRQKINSAVGHKDQVEGNCVEKAWAEFKEGVLGTAVKVCGMKRAKGEQKRTKWWNNEVKEAVKKKKVVYVAWLQQKTSEAREVYHQAKRKAKRVVRKAQNEEWVELGKSLQNDFQRNQRRFWRRVTNRSERQEAGRYVVKMVKL